MRITGLATGLDMDEIIKNSMKPYRIKVDQMTQKKDVTEIKQKLYRDIMSDATKFYDKYFDLNKSDSLLKVGSYKSVSFTSSSDAVKVTAGSGAKVGNYKITGNTATGAKATVDITAFTDIEKEGEKYKQITINGKEFDIKADSEKAMAKDLNEQLKNAGVNVSVEYTDFAGDSSGNKTGFVFQSTILGANATFTINGGTSTSLATDTTEGKDATAATIKGFTIDDIKNSDKIFIGEKEIGLQLTEEEKKDNNLIIKKMNSKLSDEGITASIEGNDIIFSSNKFGSGIKNPDIKINEKSGTFTDGEKAENAIVKINKSELTSGEKILVIGGNAINIDLSKVKAPKTEEEYLNDLLKNNGIGVSAKIVGDKIEFTSITEGSKGNFDISTASGTVGTDGTDGDITITNTKTGGVYKTSGQSNTIMVDDIIFTITDEIPPEGIKITGKNDVTETKDKLVSFINDYNTFMEKLNTLTGTKHDKAYDPLTEEQKKEMSESEIKLWNERVEKGQLYRDSNLTRIANSLKSTMRTVMDGTGLNLEKIGIKPVQDYSGKLNGTFTIDEDKLTTALEDDIEGVMNLFIGNPADGDKTTSEYTSKTGILHQLNETLRKEFKTSSSSLSQKAGMEGMSTFGNNELTKSMSDYEKKIKDMEKDFSRREQALYSKYATLETMMNKLNSQQSNLMSQLGMS
ncbi:flagellar cap protein FliD [Clostridium botulinum]|nr:flagellar cap protein FliD [Clostridium botulinum]